MVSLVRSRLATAFFATVILAIPVSALASSSTCSLATTKALQIDVKAESQSGNAATSGCKLGDKDGFPATDPSCTPGAYNPSVTLEILKNSSFRTSCLRNKATGEKAKGVTYGWYDVPHPSGAKTRTCELDHLVPLELGGADTLDNIWPQCGTDPGTHKIYFQTKDKIETCVAKKVKAGTMDLDAARKDFANDNWAKYIDQCG
jgi:hypothetical protein